MRVYKKLDKLKPYENRYIYFSGTLSLKRIGTVNAVSRLNNNSMPK